MLTSFFIRFLLILGFTLLPLLFANGFICYELLDGCTPDRVRDAQGMRYGVLVVVGSIALAATLTVFA
jgi:hypothetical protein